MVKSVISRLFFGGRGGRPTAKIGLRLPHSWGFQITYDTLQSVGHLWTRDQPDSEAHTHSTHNKHDRPTSKPLSGIQTLDPDNQGAAELRLRPHGHGFQFASMIAGQNLTLFMQTLNRKEIHSSEMLVQTYKSARRQNSWQFNRFCFLSAQTF